MKILSPEVTRLLDKLYNLRGSDSVIFKEMESAHKKAEETKERTPCPSFLLIYSSLNLSMAAFQKIYTSFYSLNCAKKKFFHIFFETHIAQGLDCEYMNFV